MVVVVVLLVQEVHRSAFNAALSASTACVHAKMMTVDKYNRIVGCIRKMEAGSTALQLKADGYPQAHQWGKKYKIVDIGGFPTLLQQCKTSVCKEVLHTDTLFDALTSLHGSDHAKGRSLFHRVSEKYANVTLAICKIYASTCPQVILTFVIFRSVRFFYSFCCFSQAYLLPLN